MNSPDQPAPRRLSRYFPVLDWGRSYGLATLTDDLLAAVIVTITAYAGCRP